MKEVFLEISQNSQENTCASASFLIKLQASGTFFHRTSPVAASVSLCRCISRKCSVEKVFRKIHRKTHVPGSLF